MLSPAAWVEFRDPSEAAFAAAFDDDGLQCHMLRRMILGLWTAFALISLGVAVLIFSLYENGEHARVARSLSELRAACEAIGARYGEGVSSRDVAAGFDRREAEFDHLVDAALTTFSGVEGGLWTTTSGFVAYGFPTYGGATPKTDIPQAEMPAIEALTREASASDVARSSKRVDRRETVLLMACPMPSPPNGVVAWTLSRIQSSGATYSGLMLAVGLLLAFVLTSGAWLALALHRYRGHFGRLRQALDSMPMQTPTNTARSGDGEIDQIVDSINALTTRLAEAQSEAAVLALQVAQSERLAALGKLSAALAHEIRNPLAAMRLKIENAQSDQSDAGTIPALTFALSQVTRLEILVRDLLAMTQGMKVTSAPVNVSQWISEHLETHRLQAGGCDLVLQQSAGDDVIHFDPLLLGRALDNLIANAIQHAPAGSKITIEAAREDAAFVIRVRDDGPGVPTALRPTIFEPFVSGRRNGTGLGLSIAREIVQAHHGTIVETAPSQGARFEIHLPWPGS